MISEKTVELNLTTELVNWIYHFSGTRPYILAPSQRQEATLGYDTSIGYPGGSGALIQYKRAYVTSPNVYEFHLNRTKKQDQHLRLFVLELLGFPVYYAFPIFHTPTEVINHRRTLLTKTKFVRPSRIVPAGGIMTGHHEVKYNSVTRAWTVHSELGTPFDGAENFGDIYEELQQEINSNNLSEIFEAYNSVFSNKQKAKIMDREIDSSDEDDFYLTNGQAILAI